MDEMTLREVTRWIAKHDAAHGDMVGRREFELVTKTMAEDVADLKEGSKWALRLIVTILVTNFVALVYFLVQNAAP